MTHLALNRSNQTLCYS